MAWRYQCHSCDEATGWMGRVDAEGARDDHRRRAHGNLAPKDSITSNAQRTDPRLLLYAFGACLLLAIFKWLRDLF